MDKNHIIKIEFTSGSSNSFNFVSNCETQIELGGKAAGKINNDFFSAKYKFNIDVPTLKISDIHFTDVTHIGETIVPENVPKTKSDLSSSYSDIVDDTFEQLVYNALYFILNNSTVSKSDKNLTMKLINKCTSDIEFLVLHIKTGSSSCSSSSSVHNVIPNSNANTNIISSPNAISTPSPDSKLTDNKLPDNTKSSSLANSQNSPLSSSTKSSTSSNIHKKKHGKQSTKNVLKLLAWSIIISFVMHILKTKLKKEHKKIK
jgi:hypothetical protein